jgi:phosphoglycolate phosphatase
LTGSRTRGRAVIFDLDGTLLDTLEDIADSMNATLRRLGFPGHEVARYRYLTGHGMLSLAERSLPARRRDGATVEACIREFRTEYENRWAAKTHPYPGIPELLDDLARRGIGLNILSNKLDKFADILVRRFLSDWEFPFVLGSRPDLPQKPDPAGALFIARGVGVPPDEFAYLGDTGVDMETAVRAGMFPVGALWGFRDEAELRENGAHAVISRPAEFKQFVA